MFLLLVAILIVLVLLMAQLSVIRFMLYLSTEIIVSLCIFVASVFAFVVVYFRTGNIKKSINTMLEVLNVKYKTFELSKEGKPSKSQSFSEYVDDYLLNPSTNELEMLTVQKNIQALIQSHVDCALQRALEKFIPSNCQDDNLVADYTQSVDDLSRLAEGMEAVEFYRDKLGLPDTYSVSQVYECVDKYAKSLKEKISLKKEVSDNGEETKTK